MLVSTGVQRNVRIVGAGLLMALLGVGCWMNPGVETGRFLPPYEVEVHTPAMSATTIRIAVSESSSRDFKTWMESHASGWSRSYTTYAPASMIRGKHFDLNVTGKTAVLNYEKRNGSWDQVCLPLTDEDCAMFERLFRKAAAGKEAK